MFLAKAAVVPLLWCIPASASTRKTPGVYVRTFEGTKHHKALGCVESVKQGDLSQYWHPHILYPLRSCMYALRRRVGVLDRLNVDNST
jgi:hypothetical protein